MRRTVFILYLYWLLASYIGVGLLTVIVISYNKSFLVLNSILSCNILTLYRLFILVCLDMRDKE